MLSRFLLLTLLAYLPSCAFVDREIQLRYPVPSSLVDTTALEGVAVYLGEFQDLRQEPARLGPVRNGLGMKTADVVVAEYSMPPEDWLQAAVKVELQRRGAHVFDPEDGVQTPADAVVLAGQLLEVSVDMYIDYDSKVAFQLQLKQQDHVLLDRRYSGKGGEMAWTTSENEYMEALNQAMHQALLSASVDWKEQLQSGVRP